MFPNVYFARTWLWMIRVTTVNTLDATQTSKLKYALTVVSSFAEIVTRN